MKQGYLLNEVYDSVSMILSMDSPLCFYEKKMSKYLQLGYSEKLTPGEKSHENQKTASHIFKKPVECWRRMIIYRLA